MSSPAPTLPEQNSAQPPITAQVTASPAGPSPDQTTAIAAQVSAAVVPVAIKAATDIVNQGHTALTKTIESGDTYLQGLMQDVDKRATEGIAANSQAIQDALGSIGGALETKLKTDPKIQSALILGTVGALLLAGLLILGFDLSGSHQAADLVGWALGAFGTSAAGILAHEFGLLGTTGQIGTDTVQVNGANSIAGGPVTTTTTTTP